jgi:hypothetical protein
MDIMLTRTIADLSYKELVNYLDDPEYCLDLAECENWLEDIIAKNIHKHHEDIETMKKIAHLALYFIDYAKEPGEGAMQ